MIELIQRELAVRSLFEVMSEWEESHLISGQEYALAIDELTNFALWQDQL
jgi:hypothetical protein